MVRSCLLAFWLENFAAGLYKGVDDGHEKVNKGCKVLLVGVALSVSCGFRRGRRRRLIFEFCNGRGLRQIHAHTPQHTQGSCIPRRGHIMLDMDVS